MTFTPKKLIPLCLLIITCTMNEMYAKKTKIAFFINFLSVRGVEVAAYDYADFNEKILGNESIIINYTLYVKPGQKDYSNTTREKFVKRFGDRFYDAATMQEVDEILKKEHCDIFYALKSGEIDDKVSKVCKNAMHAVFGCMEPHGDAYACVSESLSKNFTRTHVPCVPLMVRLHETKETLHKELGIPENAVVFGRHGGYNDFNVDCAKEAIRTIAQQYKNWYFIFLNTEQFCNLPNVIFLPLTANMEYKTKFINTCDAMIHARHGGETFGLACAEFSIRNKPVITWTGSKDKAHIDMLGNKGLYYSNTQELLDILLNIGLNKDAIKAGNWDAYTEGYNPETVMKRFDEIFIQPLIR